MFKCQITGKFSRQGDPRTGEWIHINDMDTKSAGQELHASEKVHRIVVQTRDRVYKKRVFNETTRQSEEIEVGRGWEIVREVTASQEGFDLWNSWSPEQQATWVQMKFGRKAA